MIDNLSDKDRRAFSFIRNMIISQGRSPSLREINTVTNDSSPRSAGLAIDRLVKAGLLEKKGRDLLLTSERDSSSVHTVNVKLVNNVACGTPMLAEENVEAEIAVSTALAKPGSKYFLLRASGDSMNQAGINSGDLLLIRQQTTAENGQRVVALINDEATVKEFEKNGDVVILRPRSSSKEHKPIVLTDNCIIQGVVQAVLPSDIY
jgi:repressor LexA